MTDEKTDMTSDAVRSNPDLADEAREDLSDSAQNGLHKAAGASRYRQDVDTSKTPEKENESTRPGQGYPGAITK